MSQQTAYDDFQDQMQFDAQVMRELWEKEMKVKELYQARQEEQLEEEDEYACQYCGKGYPDNENRTCCQENHICKREELEESK